MLVSKTMAQRGSVRRSGDLDEMGVVRPLAL